MNKLISESQKRTLLILQSEGNNALMLAKVNKNYSQGGIPGAMHSIKALLHNTDLTGGMISIEDQIKSIRTGIYGF